LCQQPAHGIAIYVIILGANMQTLPIALTITAAAAFVHIWHLYRCGSVRTKKKIMHGDGGDILMQRRMRAHSNFIENTPIFLMLLALVEYHTGGAIWLWAVGYAFILGRMLHSIGMDKDGENFPRIAGVLLAALPILGLAGHTLWLAMVSA
jgi:uncharacterized protein